MKKSVCNLHRILSFFLAVILMGTMLPMQAVAADTSNTDSFLNGPYLMAPKPDGMVVVWELSSAMQSSIAYGTDDAHMTELDVPVEEGAEFQGEAMHMYRARLTGLTPATQYRYTVTAENGQSISGSFRTLSENPDAVRFVVVSDTHRFETASQVSDAIEAFDPDFILHTGDMVEGTGTQKDQFAYWFQNIGSFLHNIPVIYNGGNHDYGVYYDEYVTKIQQEQFTSNENGHNISFNYGDAHFTMVDSNPWSLFELNASASGDSETHSNVEDSLNWIQDDLASADAKNADFRILTMHHPYEDDLTRKYIPSIAEAGNVNVMFSGHTHVYSYTASANPERGAQTLYVTQGDARVGDGKVSKGDADVRVNENFPEVLATGKGDMLEVVIQDGLLTYSDLGLSGGAEKVIDTVTVSKDGPQLQYEDISITPDSVQSNGSVTVSAKVTNVGTGLAAVAFKINDNGTARYLYTFGQAGKERVQALEPGESATLSAELSLSDLGTHTLNMEGYSKQVAVTFRDATYVADHLRIKLGDGDVSDLTSDILHAKADVTNIGNASGKKAVALYVDGAAIETRTVTLQAGESKSVEFNYDFPESGSYEVRIGDSDAETVTIAGEIQGTPIVKDQSGNGNDGIIRGNPTLVQYNGGWGLSLDGIDDYVEIPDRENYVVDDGVTGMVWANIDRLAQSGEWDHNPLLMKGASISYGTNYLYRMAVRQTGMLTYGIGFDNDNGEYFWNDDDKIEGTGAQLGIWTQYTGGFDRETGGTSWENTMCSGEIDAPNFDSEIKNWSGASMYAGFAFHRHLLENRERGKTHTMLTGDIGQIRFYTKKLTDAENKAIYAAPDSAGPEADQLVVWLDFNPTNIVTDGTQTTEWRSVIGSLHTFSFETAIAGSASAKAVIQTSDDGTTVKESQEITLQDGSGVADLTQLGSAKYVRVVTELHSAVGETETNMPVIKSYVIDAGNRNAWTTLADWNRGTFEGAVGWQSTDCFVDYTADYDDYSGEADITDMPSGTDLVQGYWATADIQNLISQNIVQGDADTGYVRPRAYITREEAVSAILKALQVPADTQGALSAGDGSSAWAAGILAAAKERGIMSGDENGYMNGTRYATRAEIAVMLARAAGISSEDISVLQQFTDNASIPSWAKSSIAGLVDQGFLTGYQDYTLRLNNKITRAETFALINALLQ